MPIQPAALESERDYPSFRSHFVPRTCTARVALGVFLSVFALAEPPLLYVLANRIEPFVLGLPFLYAYLLAVYAALIAVLFWIQRQGL